MKIAVFIKQVPDINEKKENCMDAKTGLLLRGKLNAITNPYDLAALESALRLKDEYKATVDVFTMGPEGAKSVIRNAYSMGADRGYLICDKYFSGADVLATSYTLYQAVCSVDKYDLYICGERTLDGDTAQVGAAIASWIKIPYCNKVKKIKCINKKNTTDLKNIDVVYELDNKEIESQLSIPCLITAKKDVFIPRLATLKLKIKSRKKDIKILTLNDFKDNEKNHYGINFSPTKVSKVYPVDIKKLRNIMFFTDDINSSQIISLIKNR